MRADIPPQMQSDLIKERITYQRKMAAQLALWRADIATMEAQLEDVPANERINLQKLLTALKTKMQQAEEQLAKMKDTTGDTWTELQKEFNTTLEKIKPPVTQLQKYQ